MVISKQIFNYLKKNENFEKITLKKLSKMKKNIFAFRHDGFWQCVDTLRDKKILENILNRWNLYKFKNLDSRDFAIMISLAHEYQKGEEALRFFDASIDKLDLLELIVGKIAVFYQVVDIILFTDQNF